VGGCQQGKTDLSRRPLVSVLLPAWNEAARVGPCIESFRALRYPNKELVVCAGGADGTLRIAGAYAGPGTLVLEQRAGQGKQAALRQCFAQATGEIVFLTDADCVLDDACFEGTLGPVISGEEDVATGGWRPLDEQAAHPFVQYQWTHHVYRDVWMPQYAPTLDGKNAAVRREALEQVGGFEAEAPIGTDCVLSRQLAAAGYRIRYVRESQVRTEYAEMARAYCRQQSRWFRNRLVLAAHRGETGEAWSHLVTAVKALFLLSLPVLGGLGSRFLLTLWSASAFHLALCQVRYSRLAREWGNLRPCSSREYLGYGVYAVLGWMAMVRGLVDALVPKRRWQW
jgi:cellulose synthase/poly-beta-1,6-N-acetylglucosamine synthase-like glycosyltransferase